VIGIVAEDPKRSLSMKAVVPALVLMTALVACTSTETDAVRRLRNQKSVALFSVNGVTNDPEGLTSTFFVCANKSPEPVTIGVEIFNGPSRKPLNQASDTAITVMPDESGSILTDDANDVIADAKLKVGPLSGASARILATRPDQISCRVYIINTDTTMPSGVLEVKGPNELSSTQAQ